MIGYIQGKVLDTDGKKAIVLTESGIGYEINYGYFADKKSNIALFIHHHISDSDASLWGFNNLEDKKMFEFLKTVNKVGSSKAYPLITTIGIKGITEAILFNRPKVLSQAPGIGKKMAELIILSLGDKVQKFSATYLEIGITSPQENITASKPLMDEVLMALDSLGYKDQDMMPMVRRELESGLNSSGEIIKAILRQL